MAHHYAICMKNDGSDVSLELRKLYEVVPDFEADKIGQIRVVDESGEDYLYPKDFFLAVPLPESIEKLVSLVA